jgi:hypothetical protein
MKPCVEGLFRGCRPYLAIDNMFLTGKFRGQLCITCAVDGHKWMYLVAIGVIDSKTNENWIWFMERLKEAIGTPPSLTFCIDCGQEVMTGVSEVFPNAEHRECMGTWCRILRKGSLEMFLMNICGMLLILGIHTCLKSISRPWLKQIQ